MPVKVPDGLGPELVSRGWKKLGRHHYVDLNEETMAHILPYWQGYKAERLHAQLGTTDKRLNRVSWDARAR